jgi:hypothetical protein
VPGGVADRRLVLVERLDDHLAGQVGREKGDWLRRCLRLLSV